MNDLFAAEPALQSLMEFARQAALHSYSPYSHFRVGAALKLSNGEIDGIVQRIVGDTQVRGVEYEDVCTGEVATLPVDGVFVFVGQTPNTAFLQGVVDLDAEEYIVTDDRLHTSCAGVFASGDARANHLKQIACAVGEGALAAVQMDRYLDTL